MPTLAPKLLSISKTQAKANAQAMYEIQGLTMELIAEKIGVSYNTIKNWANVDGWRGRKGIFVPEITKITRESFIEKAALAGMTQDKLIELTIQGMTTPRKDAIIVEKDGKPITLYEGTPDYGAMHKYHRDFMLIAGLLPSGNGGNGMTINAGEGTVNMQLYIPQKDTSK